jgi:hypothetical protein
VLGLRRRPEGIDRPDAASHGEMRVMQLGIIFHPSDRLLEDFLVGRLALRPVADEGQKREARFQGPARGTKRAIRIL